jgi:anti-sigma B factor antagonist
MPADMEFSVETLAGLPVVTAPSVIDQDNAWNLDAAIHSAAARGDATVIVDLSRTMICLSPGVRVLVRRHQEAAAAGGELRLVISTASLLRFFAIIGVDRVFPIFVTLAGALDEPPAASAGGRVGHDGAEPAAMEDQRLAGVDPDPVHPADDDVVITARDHVFVRALDVRDAAVEQRRSEDAHPPVQPGELVLRGAGEPHRDLLLVGGQDVDGEVLAAVEPGQARCLVGDAEQDQRRLERDGRE